jgi:putative transposase
MGSLERSATVKLACPAFGINQTCYRYKAKLDAENNLIADWLVRPDEQPAQRERLQMEPQARLGIYRELRAEPADQTASSSVREKPLPLAVPGSIRAGRWTSALTSGCR